MSDKPILFSAAMVRSLLHWSKTQTRRVAKITAIMGNKAAIESPDESLIELEPGEFQRGIFHYSSTGGLSGPYRLPYSVGDRLWVREAWRTDVTADDFTPRQIMDAFETPEWGYPGELPVIRFEADGAFNSDYSWFDAGRYRHGRFMPRALSRLTLTVTDVRVERLQDISGGDALAEGVECVTCAAMGRSACGRMGCQAAVQAYALLWDAINGDGAWKANPWVAAYTFTKENSNG